MALLSQTLDNLLNGVSQQPPRQRHPSQSAAEVNTMAVKGEGLMKRPPTEHVALLDAGPVTDAFIFPISYSEDERYLAVFTGSDVRVFDVETAEELPVTLSASGTAYLTGVSAPDLFSDFWRAVTIQDHTVVLNRSKVVAKGTASAEVRDPEALIYIRQADYGTTYAVTVDGNTYSYATGSGTSPDARTAIGTDAIATELTTLLDDALTGFTVTRYGSTIHLTKADGSDFTIGSKDGLADEGLITVKGKIQRFSDLPAVGVDGFVVEITGDPGTAADNYWVVYEDGLTPEQAGVWRETVKPGLLTDFSVGTLPHALIRNGSIIPEFEQAGADITPPTVAPYGSGGLQQVGFEDHFWDIDTEGGAGNNNTKLKDDGAIGYSNLKFATGLSTEFTVNYDVTTEEMDAANALTVTVRYNLSQGSTTWTTAGVKRYEGNNYDRQDSIVFTAAIPANCDISVIIAYDEAPVHTTYVDQRAQVTLRGEDNAVDVGVEFTPPTDIDLTFDATGYYPVGYTVNATVDGHAVSYTVATAAMTGAALATAFEPTIEAVVNISSAVTSPGVIRITRTTSGVATVVITDASQATDTHAWNLAGGLTVDALIGMTIENVTDGSSGVITDNGVDWISVASLTGGATNLFNIGNVCRIIDTPNLPYFVFRELDWSSRGVGDDTSNPFPSFTGKTLDEVFYTQGRLGLTSGPNVILSQSDDLFNFFRGTVTDLRDNDPIDITSMGAVQEFHGAVQWNEDTILFSEKGQYRLFSEGGLTPKTVSLPQVSQYESSPDVRPAAVGTSVFFPVKSGAYTQVAEMRLAEDGLRAIAQPITVEVPRYLVGKATDLAGIAAAGLLVVLTDDDRSKLFAYCYSDESNGRVMGGWRTWQFPAGCEILGVSGFGAHTLALVINYADGLYLETLDLSRREDGDLAFPIHLDRRATPASVVVDPGDPPDTPITSTFTLPYDVALDDSEGEVAVVLKATGAVIPSTRTETDAVTVEGTYAATDVWVGIVPSFLYQPSRLFLRRQASPENTGRLDLKWLTVITNRTRSYLLRVAQTDRDDKTRSYTGTSLDDVSRRYPLQGRTEDLVISIEDTSPQPLCLTAIEWEGTYSPRHQRP